MSQFLGSCRFAPCSETEDRIVWDGLETLYEGKLYRESFAPGAFIARPAENPAKVRDGHDGPALATVTVWTAHRNWFLADFIIDEGPEQELALEKIKPGVRVSLGGRSIRRYDNPDLRLVRHTLATLDEIAILRRGDVPGYVGAEVTTIRELKTKPAKAAVEPPKTPKPIVRQPAAPSARIACGYALKPGEELWDHERGVVTDHTGRVTRRTWRLGDESQKRTPGYVQQPGDVEIPCTGELVTRYFPSEITIR